MTPHHHHKKLLPAAPLRALLLLPLLWLGTAASLAQPLPAPQAEQTRKASFVYDETTGLLKEEWVEPDNPELCVKTTHEYDPYGNRSKTTTAPCPGAGGTAGFSARYAITDHSAAAQLTANVLPRLGREIRSLTQAFDAGSEATRGWFIAADTRYNANGAKILSTQPYFIDNTGAARGSLPGSAAGAAYGIRFIHHDVLGRAVFTMSSEGEGTAGPEP